METSSAGHIDETEPLLSDRLPHEPAAGASPVAKRWPSRRWPDSSSENHRLVFAIAGALLSFFMLGMTASSLGVMIPYMQESYRLSDIEVSAVFLAGPTGFLVSALSSHSIHLRFGRRGISIIGPICLIFFAATGASCPPFHLFMVAVAVGGFGGGLMDGSWNAWIGSMDNANTLTGLLHGSFSVGAAAGPFLAGLLVSVKHMPWYSWYYVMLGLSIIEAIVLFFAFRFESAEKYRDARQPEEMLTEESSPKALVAYPATWVYAAYLLIYDGSETTVSNWLVAFMIRVRGASPFLSSLCSSGFWTGTAIGRFSLGPVTDRLGVRLAVAIYLFSALAITMLFAVVKAQYVSAGLVALLGFFFGPLFPSGIIQLLRSLPIQLHVKGVSFVASTGQVGGALLPYLLGAITESFGLEAFQYMVMVQVAITLAIWILSLKLPAT